MRVHTAIAGLMSVALMVATGVDAAGSRDLTIELRISGGG